MRQIDDYQFTVDGVEIFHFDDTKNEDAEKVFVDNDTIKKAFESLGWGYDGTKFNNDLTDLIDVTYCKEGEELEYVLDQLQNAMRSDDVQDILKKAMELK